MQPRIVFLSSILSVGALACGIDAGNVFFAPGSGGTAQGGQAQGGQGGSGNEGQGASSQGGVSNGGASQGGQGGVSNGGASQGGQGGVSNGGASQGGQSQGGQSQGGQNQGGQPPVGPIVECGGGACAPGQQCCYHYQDANLDACAPGGSDCGQGFLELACDGSDDCPGDQVCCAMYQQSGQGGYYVSVGCAAPTPQGSFGSACGFPQDGQFGVIMCSGPSGGVDCPFGDDCEPSGGLQGYDVCK